MLVSISQRCRSVTPLFMYKVCSKNGHIHTFDGNSNLLEHFIKYCFIQIFFIYI